jgi:hypothetical protein
MRYRQVQVIGGGFRSAIRGLAADSHGLLYAAGDSQIQVFDAAGSLKRQWATSHPAHSVAVAGDGTVYVGQEGQVEIFDASGKPVRAWRNPELLGRVTAIGFVKDSVLAADAADRAIRRFHLNGSFLNNIGKDNAVRGFLIPNGVLDFGVDAQGVIHAANPGKHRVERYSPAGDLLGHIGRFDGNDPAGFTGCCNPTNVAVSDRIYVTEKAVPRAKAYDFGGRLLAVIASDVFDANVKNMSIAAGPRGRVYVVDTVKLAILAFEPVAP